VSVRELLACAANQDVVTSTPVVALWSAMTPLRACTASNPTTLVQRLAWSAGGNVERAHQFRAVVADPTAQP
jgi:hypothetical protein